MLTNLELVTLHNFLTTEEKLDTIEMSCDAFLAMKSNLDLLIPKFKILIEAERKYNVVSEDFQKYLDERNEIAKSFAKKDDEGNLILSEKGDVQIDNESIKDLEKSLEELKGIHIEAIDKHSNDIQAWQRTLDSDSEVDIKLIKKDDVEWSGFKLNPAGYRAFYLMIETV